VRDLQSGNRIRYSIGWIAQCSSIFQDLSMPDGSVMRLMDKCVHRAAAESAAKRLCELSHASGTRILPMTHEPAQQIEGSKSPLDPIFPRLVNEAEGPEQKLIGLIAYGLFQEAKREWVSDFQTREGRYPNDEELREYERFWTPSRLEALQNAAVQAIAAYTDSIVSQAETQILRNALKGSFSRTAWRWVAGALLYTFIIIGVAVALGRSGIDLSRLLTR
jgi:hypothetical protein